MKNVATRLIVFVALIAMLVSCKQNMRQETIKTALVATNAARDGFVQYDAFVQQKIVDEATSLEAGKAALTEYRTKRAKVLALFPIVYFSIIAAAQGNNDATFNKMKANLKELLDAITPLLGGVL